jgi:heme/copper-type cytochrome/quinol oxidase subunit 2
MSARFQPASTRTAIVVLLFALASVVAAQAPADRRVVRIKAERFAFTPSEVSMAAGEEIEIRLKSDDTAHGFKLVGQDVDITIPKRGQGEATVLFKPAKPGRYAFECSHLCGAGHSFMRGVIVVKEGKP